jgi:hypothetical protein
MANWDFQEFYYMTARMPAFRKHDFFLQTSRNPRRTARLKLEFRPWSRLLIACVGLILGIRFLCDPSTLVTLMGLALLVRVPAYFYLAWCDYGRRKEARLTLTLEWYLENRNVLRGRAASGDSSPDDSETLLYST